MFYEKNVTDEVAATSSFSAVISRRRAANALSALISDEELFADYIIPKAFDPRVGKAVAEAVAEAARKTGVARI